MRLTRGSIHKLLYRNQNQTRKEKNQLSSHQQQQQQQQKSKSRSMTYCNHKETKLKKSIYDQTLKTSDWKRCLPNQDL